MNQHNEIAQRARTASMFLVAVFLFLGGAFFKTQVIQYRSFALKSERNRLRSVPIPAPRGIIYDRNNEIIVENVPGFSVSLFSPSVDSLRATLMRFSELIPLDTDVVERLASKRTFRADRPTMVLSDASFEQVALLEEHKATDLPGLVVRPAPKRKYPDGFAVAAFTGYTSEISESLLLDTVRYAGYKPGQQIGTMGLEEQYEQKLRGVEGQRYYEVDAEGREVVREGSVRPVLDPVAGENLYTNIDLDLNRFIRDSVFIREMRGGVIAFEPETGAVRALFSAPSFDPNDFIGGISRAKFNALVEDPDRPLYNKVIKAKYPPASTFKLVTAVLGLETGEVTMDTRMPVPCYGSYRLGNREFGCWKKEGHGSATLAEAIIGSCNVYFFQLGQRLGLQRLLSGATRLGFSGTSGIDLPGELPSTFPEDIEYYNRRFPNGGWSRQASELNLSIGQGEATQTVANMARFYSALATDGYAAKPQLIKGIAPEREKLLSLTPEQARGVRDALAGVVSRGTAAASQIAGLTQAGKTGTAQNVPGKAAHAWYVGFAPADRPRLLIALIIEHGEHGSDAARAASKIFAHYFKQPINQLTQTGG